MLPAVKVKLTSSMNIVDKLYHQNINNKKEKHVPCFECGELFTDSYGLQIHLKSHSIFAMSE